MPGILVWGWYLVCLTLIAMLVAVSSVPEKTSMTAGSDEAPLPLKDGIRIV